MKIAIIGATVFIILAMLANFTQYYIGVEAFLGVFFLTGITILTHYFVVSARDKAGSASIRRIMIASFLRMMLALVFLIITLMNVHPVKWSFVISYCAYFAFLLVFEISEMRSNLRPVSEQGENIENA